MTVLIQNACIITLDKANRVINKGATLINGDKILEIGKSTELEKKYSNADKIINANGRIVMPGFINSHMHFYSAFATGMLLKDSPKGFVEILRKLWWKLDKALQKDDIYYSALLGYIEALKSGTTTIIDHHASPSYINGSLDEIERAARDLGVRSNLCYEVTNRNGEEEAHIGLEENYRFISKCQKANDDMMEGLLGLHASFTISSQVVEEAQKIVEELNTGVHIHVAEGKADMEDAREKYGTTIVERLHKYNLLNPKSILAHCIHIEDKDYLTIKKKEPNVVHQPRSNMNNAVGAFNLPKFQQHDITFGLGTDGMSADMKAELMVGNLIHKHVQQDNTVGTMDIFDALFKQNPIIVERTMGVKTGSLAIGKKADVIVTEYYPRSPISPDNVLGHIMFGVLNGGVATTVINGRVCMEERVIPQINEKAISDRCQDLANEVWERL